MSMALEDDANFSDYRTMAMEYLRSGEIRSAVCALEKHLELFERDEWGHFTLAQCLQKLGYEQAAERELHKVLELNRGHTDALCEYAHLLSKRGCTEGVRLLRERIRENPQNVRFHYSLSVCLNLLGDSFSADSERVEVLQIDPEHESAAVEHARTLIAEGRYHDAIATLEPGIRHHPDRRESMHLVALCRKHLGNLRGAEEMWMRLLADDPGHEGAVHELGKLLEADHRYLQLRQILRGFLRQKPESVKERFALAVVLCKEKCRCKQGPNSIRGDLCEAGREWARILSRGKEHVASQKRLFQAGIHCYRVGDREAANFAWQCVLDSLPADEGKWRLGEMLARTRGFQPRVDAEREAVSAGALLSRTMESQGLAESQAPVKPRVASPRGRWTRAVPAFAAVAILVACSYFLGVPPLRHTLVALAIATVWYGAYRLVEFSRRRVRIALVRHLRRRRAARGSGETGGTPKTSQLDSFWAWVERFSAPEPKGGKPRDRFERQMSAVLFWGGSGVVVCLWLFAFCAGFDCLSPAAFLAIAGGYLVLAAIVWSFISSYYASPRWSIVGFLPFGGLIFLLRREWRRRLTRPVLSTLGFVSYGVLVLAVVWFSSPMGMRIGRSLMADTARAGTHGALRAAVESISNLGARPEPVASMAGSPVRAPNAQSAARRAVPASPSADGSGGGAAGPDPEDGLALQRHWELFP